MKVFRIILFGAFIFLVFYFCVFPQNGIEEKISKGEVQYCEEFGFVNWGHAKPERTVEAFKNLQQLNKQSTDSFEFAYSQKTLLDIGGVFIVARYMETRKFPPHQSPEEEKMAFLEIFTAVSESFESMQGDFPMAMLSDARSSSFRKGDLTGDLLSFYMAVSGKTLPEVKRGLSVVSSDAAYTKAKEGNTESKDWKTFFEKHKDAGKRLGGLEEMIIATTELKKTLSNKISEKREYYFE